jgi:predicted amidohydrolase
MDNLRVASVQFESHPLDKTANLARVEHFAAEAARLGAHLVVTPECCLTGYMPLTTLDRPALREVAELVPDGPAAQRLGELAARIGIAIGAGLVELGGDGRVYNTYVVAAPDGAIHSFRKFHAFISEHVSSGDGYTVFDYRGWRVGVLICYDNNQPECGRVLAIEGVQVLLAPHQTGAFPLPYAGMGLIDRGVWDRREDDPAALRAEIVGPKGREWLMRWLPSRAYDNGCYLVFSNGVGVDGEEVRTGNTMILDPHGRVLAETAAAGDDMILADLSPKPLGHNLGHCHMQTRRPELYGRLRDAVEGGMDTKASRHAAIADTEA